MRSIKEIVQGWKESYEKRDQKKYFEGFFAGRDTAWECKPNDINLLYKDILDACKTENERKSLLDGFDSGYHSAWDEDEYYYGEVDY